MKRRSSLRSDSGREERRLGGGRNLRRRTRINYRDDDEDYSEEDDRSQPPTCEDRELWPVTCGDKEGMMDAHKLAKGEECIECEGHMFTPPAFEEFGGRGPAKKWKTSIYSGGKPLQHWFDEDLLSTEGYNRTKTYKKRQSFQNNGGEAAHDLRRRDAQGSGESGEDATDDSENDDGIPSGCRSWLPWAEGETERNDSDHPDEEPDELENDGDGNDKDDEDLCAPQEPDPRLIISTPEKLALQKNSFVLLQRISATRSRCQAAAAAAEHQRKDDGEGGGDSATNRDEKTKGGEGEEPREPVGSETADVATNTSPREEPAEQKVHESQRLSADTLALPGSSARDGHAAASVLDPFESQTMAEARSVCDSDSTHISDVAETSTSGVLTGSDVDSMDLDQLQREALKTQLEAAREQKEASRIQKEYYALKLRLLRVRMKAGRFGWPMRAAMQL